MSNRPLADVAMTNAGDALGSLTGLDHLEFVSNSYRVVLGRMPTRLEQDAMLSGLMRGDAKTWLLGALRYGKEGRARRVPIAGLRLRYLAQCAFRAPGLGPLLSWVNAVLRLPQALRYFRAAEQATAGKLSEMRGFAEKESERHEQAIGALTPEVQRMQVSQATVAQIEQLAAEFAAAEQAAATNLSVLRGFAEKEIGRHEQAIGALTLEARRIDASRATGAQVERLGQETAELRRIVERLDRHGEPLEKSIEEIRSGLNRICPPPLTETLEIAGSPLIDLARERAGIASATPIASLSSDARYALFETIFYESPAVAAKQRVYIPYIDRGLTRQFPFLDLGCGRGEFLRILRDEGIEGIGVDINATVLAKLRAEAFDVAESDIVKFLQNDRKTYAGASVLQVVEHLPNSDIEKMLALIAARLAPGAVLIVETPNPLSPFALGVFHTDPTHVAPLPPERMRYLIEAAGFERTRTLFQARIPADQFAGPDRRAYYADYAIIAQRLRS